MSFLSKKGLFFYETIVRKDLVNKVIFVCDSEIPKIETIKAFVKTDQQKRQISDSVLFDLVCLFELLFGDFIFIKKLRYLKMDYFTQLQDFEICINIFGFSIYDLFLNIYFLWFRSLSFVVEESINKFATKEGSKVTFDELPARNVVKIVYFKYKCPVVKCFSEKNDSNKLIGSNWFDFNFCLHVPLNVLDSIVDFSLRINFFFNTNINIYKVLLLSGLRLFHRFIIK